MVVKKYIGNCLIGLIENMLIDETFTFEIKQ